MVSKENISRTMLESVGGFEPMIIAVVVSIVIGLMTIVFLLCRLRSASRKGVLLVGLCDSGKTLIYNRLIHDRFVETQTSIKENSASYNVKGERKRTVNVIDLPGHERIRVQMWDKYKDLARAVIFTVDSLTLQKEVKDVAGLLYTLLSDGVVIANGLPVLIACNKSDLTRAKGAKVIESQLEKEMDTLRVTQTAALQSLDSSDGGGQKVFLGRRGESFRFADLRPTCVSFVECSAKGDAAQLGDLETWLSKIA